MNKIYKNSRAISSVSFSLIVMLCFSGLLQAGARRNNNDLMSQLGATRSFSSRPTARFFSTLPQCTTDSSIPGNVTAQGPALVFNDPATLKDAFSFKKTLEMIVAGADQETSAIELLSTMVNSHQLSSAINPESNVLMPLDEREDEALMDPQAMIDEFVPVGLFNRFEMAALDGSNCGEYRIVYANPRNPINSTLQAGLGRFFIIFEGALANPLPNEGVRGCLPIAEFWASLGQGKAVQDMSTTEKVEAVNKLEEFYYQGLSVSHAGTTIEIEPVVQQKNYRSPFGQVRTNIFMEFNWQLREFRTDISSQGQAIFKVETVKNNALTELFNQEHVFSEGDADNVARSEALRDDFQQDFLDTMLDQLAAPEQNSINAFEVLNQIVLPIPNRYNEFQSDSQSSRDDLSNNNNSDSLFRADMADKMVDINTALGRSGNALLTTSHMLERAEASTCGGCHQKSNNAIVGVDEQGNNIRWPNSLGFVHINEEGNLSPALKNTFLPAREKVLESFVCNPPKLTLLVKKDSQQGHIESSTYDFNSEHPEGKSQVVFLTASPEQGPTSEKWKGSGFSPLVVKVENDSGEQFELNLRGYRIRHWNSHKEMNSAQNYYQFTDSKFKLQYRAEDNPHLPTGHYQNKDEEKLVIDVKKWRGSVVESLEYHVDITIEKNADTISDITVDRGGWLRFTIPVNSNQAGKTLTVRTEGSNGDADLYIRFNEEPTYSVFECRGFSGSSNELCSVPTRIGNFHIGVRGFRAAENVTLTWTID